ncbi:MAG: hypothetical protein ACHREM_13145 [Polyangiales bacterium]
MPQVLFDDPFVEFSFDAERRLARFKRKRARFADVAEGERTFERVLAARQSIVLTDVRLLIDQRDVVGNNSPEFEQMIGRYSARILAGASKVAFLVATVAGKLQIERMMGGRGAKKTSAVFTEEGAALAFLMRDDA